MKGVIYMRGTPALKERILQKFKEGDHNVIISEDFEVLEVELWKYEPDFVMLHCHTFGIENFESIKYLTKDIKRKLSNCFVIIMFHHSAGEKYIRENILDYEFDDIIPETFENIIQYVNQLR